MATQIEKMIAQLISETIKQDLTQEQKIQAVTEEMPRILAEKLGMTTEQMKLLFFGVARKIEGAL